jgi:hypothetical protein
MLAILPRRSFQDTKRWKVKYILRTMFSTTVVLQFRELYECTGLVRSFIQVRFYLYHSPRINDLHTFHGDADSNFAIYSSRA